MRKLTRRTIALLTGVLVLLGAGIAFAAWTSTGTGQATATATNAVDLQVTGATATGLFPTGSVDVPFTVNNPNPYAVTLTGASGANFTVDAGHSGCNVASLSADALVLTSRIAANGTLTGSKITVRMSNAANNSCQGATFTFDITVVGASSS